MFSHIVKRLPVMALLASAMLFVGCEHDGGGEADVGDNDINLVVCAGDSITLGYACDGPTYPTQLAAMSGKRVRNCGVGGVTASYGASKISSYLSCKPGYVCILYGANDAIHGRSAAETKRNLRAIIGACKKNKSIPILATTPPMIKGHSLYDGAARSVNIAIRELASEEGVALVDLYKAFGSAEGYLVPDGLHPNAAGAELIAKCFLGAL